MSASHTTLLSKRQVLKRPGWTPKKISRDLGEPDEEREQNGAIAKLYALARVEAVEAEWPTPPVPSGKSNSRSNKQSSKAKKNPKRRSRSGGMTDKQEDELHQSMLYQLKDGISDEELLDSTYSRAKLLRRGWTVGLINDLLGEPHWLLPNPKYPNAGAPMKLWHRSRVAQLERTTIWQERRSRRPDVEVATEPGTPLDNLAVVDGWHPAGEKWWRLLGAPMYPRALASVDERGGWLNVMPPVEADRAHQWDPYVYADLLENASGEMPDLVPLGNSYETCSGCQCPLAPDPEPIACPSCGMIVDTLALEDDTKSLLAVVGYYETEQQLANVAAAIAAPFLEIHYSRWLGRTKH